MTYRGVAVAAVILAAVAAIIYGVLAMHKWYRECDDAGGKVERRWEYATIAMTNHYDQKGNLTYISFDTYQHYSYHCWANGQEVLPSWTS